MVLWYWPSAASPDESIVALRKVFPPGATVYTVGLPTPATGERMVAVIARIPRPGIVYNLLAGSWGQPYFRNFSWDVARIGACPVVGDDGLKALKLPREMDLDVMLRDAIWCAPEHGPPPTRTQSRRVQRKLERVEAEMPSGSPHVYQPSFFAYRDLIRV